jgi:hypothetical protein
MNRRELLEATGDSSKADETGSLTGPWGKSKSWVCDPEFVAIIGELPAQAEQPITEVLAHQARPMLRRAIW